MTETKQVTDFLENLYQGPTRQEPQSTNSLAPEQMQMLKAVMEKLVNYGLLSDPGKIRDWSNGLADKSPKELAEGVRKAKDYRGPLSLGEFRNMCTYIAPLEERIAKDRQLAHQKSDPETIEMYKRQRKQTHGI